MTYAETLTRRPADRRRPWQRLPWPMLWALVVLSACKAEPPTEPSASAPDLGSGDPSSPPPAPTDPEDPRLTESFSLRMDATGGPTGTGVGRVVTVWNKTSGHIGFYHLSPAGPGGHGWDIGPDRSLWFGVEVGTVHCVVIPPTNRLARTIWSNLPTTLDRIKHNGRCYTIMPETPGSYAGNLIEVTGPAAVRLKTYPLRIRTPSAVIGVRG